MGIRTKPASSAPTAAPAVFKAYSAPLERAASSVSLANQRIAMGKVAPRAAAGTKHENQADGETDGGEQHAAPVAP